MFLYVVALVIITLLIIIQSKKSLHMLQQNLYNENNRYLKWIVKNSKSFLNIQIVGIFISLIGFLEFYNNKNISYLLVIILMICFIYEIYYLNKISMTEQVKKPLVITKRVKRLIITTSILYFIPIIYLFCKIENLKIVWLMFLIIIIMTYLNKIVVFIANIINFPYEKGVYYYYMSKAKSTLRNRPNMKVIGITGSYGKTSSKNILADILNIKYNALPTPRNLNTPNGLMITINNHLDKFTDIFIAEMGAYVRGEIKDLCNLVHPKYGILTTIGKAHLESFGSEENIQKAKFELIESLPADGIGVLNRDDPKQVGYKLKNQVKIIWIGIDSKDADIKASDIVCNSEGTKFKVKFYNQKEKYEFQTKLLGRHNVYNILAALALGYEFGISIEELQQALRTVKPVEHRLELKKLGNFYQIDDAYNSNPVGAEEAVKVLGMMPGVKVIVTPGMIELGKEENKYNKEFGRQIAANTDYAVLIGKNKTKPIYEGLIEQGFDENHIIIYNDVKEAYTFINSLAIKNKKNVYALFENDLPDTYNE